MATLFVQQRKRQQTLLLVFGGIVIITLVLFWFGTRTGGDAPLSEDSPEEGFTPLVPDLLEINSESLFNSPLRGLNPPPVPTELPENPGRENPFL